MNEAEDTYKQVQADLKADEEAKRIKARKRNRRRLFLFGATCVWMIPVVAWLAPSGMPGAQWILSGILLLVTGAISIGIATESFDNLPFDL